MSETEDPKPFKWNLSLWTEIRLFWLARIKKHIWCRVFHDKHRCYPNVSDDRGPEDAWHCSECTPCGMSFDLLEEHFKREKKKKNSA